MKKVIIYVLLLLSFPLMAQTNWKPYSSEISFQIKNAGATVTGRFGTLNTSLSFSPDKLANSVLKGSADVNTIKTGINKRDEDLKKEHYFDASKYKTIEVVSTKIYKKGTQYAGLFNVTIKGVTKQVEIPFEFTESGKEASFNSTFQLNRRDYGVGGKSMMMSDDLTVTIAIKAKS